MTQQWLIKIITGPHAGAAIPSGEGCYRIGSDDVCDLILSDPDIAAQHLELIIDEDGIRICSLDEASVRLDGKLISSESVDVEIFQVISIGSTHFAVGPAELCPDHFPIPELIEEKPDEADDEEEAEPEEENTMEPQQARGGKQRLVTYAAMILVLSGAALMLSGAGNFLKSSKADLPPEKTVSQQVEEMLAEIEMTHLTLIENPRGGRVLKGYVENRSRKRLLEDRLSMLSLRDVVGPDLKITDLMMHSCNDILGQFGLALDVVINTEGALTISGFAEEEEAWGKARTTIERDVPGIEKLNSGVITATQLERSLLSSLGETMPDHGLTVAWSDGALEIGGALPRAQTRQWLTIKAAFTETYKNRFEIREQFVLIRQKQVKVDPGLSISGVHIGATRFITLQDGNKVFEGAILPGGQTLVGIKHDHLLLRRNGHLLEYPIGGSH